MFMLQKFNGFSEVERWPVPADEKLPVFLLMITSWKLYAVRRHEILAKREIPLTFRDVDVPQQISGI